MSFSRRSRYNSDILPLFLPIHRAFNNIKGNFLTQRAEWIDGLLMNTLSSQNKSTWIISDDHVASCLTGFSSHEKLWHCPANWFIRSSYPVSRFKEDLLSKAAISISQSTQISLTSPKCLEQEPSSPCGVLITLLTNCIALLSGLFCRNSIKVNVFKAGVIGVCALALIPQWYPRLSQHPPALLLRCFLQAIKVELQQTGPSLHDTACRQKGKAEMRNKRRQSNTGCSICWVTRGPSIMQLGAAHYGLWACVTRR